MPSKRAPATAATKAHAAPPPGKVAVRTPNVPGYTNHVDATKYAAMRAVVLDVFRARTALLTQAQMMQAIEQHAGARAFPGTTYQWWGKCVQLDLEANGVLERDGGKPLRWRRVRDA